MKRRPLKEEAVSDSSSSSFRILASSGETFPSLTFDLVY